MKEKMLACARGHWQDEIVRRLVEYGEIDNPLSALQGRAKNYYFRYKESMENLFSRLEKVGVKLDIEYGPRGGMYGARYFVVD